MHYFFLEGHILSPGEKVSLPAADVNHAWRVLRLKSGDRVVVADGLGNGRLGTITRSSSQEVIVSLGDSVSPAESPLNITLFQALLKSDKMDLVIRQAVELGVDNIVPLVTARSVFRGETERFQNKLIRWRKKVISASAQCRRLYLPSVEVVQQFESVLPRVKGVGTIVPWEGESVIPLGKLLKLSRLQSEAISIFIGPEGGFTEAEIEALHEAGAETVKMGPRIMRSETAAAAVIAIIQAYWGDIGGEG